MGRYGSKSTREDGERKPCGNHTPSYITSVSGNRFLMKTLKVRASNRVKYEQHKRRLSILLVYYRFISNNKRLLPAGFYFRHRFISRLKLKTNSFNSNGFVRSTIKAGQLRVSGRLLRLRLRKAALCSIGLRYGLYRLFYSVCGVMARLVAAHQRNGIWKKKTLTDHVFNRVPLRFSLIRTHGENVADSNVFERTRLSV